MGHYWQFLTPIEDPLGDVSKIEISPIYMFSSIENSIPRPKIAYGAGK